MNTKIGVKVILGNEEIWVGKSYDFGFHSYSEEEIISFAKRSDPLWLHTQPEAAKNGPWKGIIASGPMLFIEFHKSHWIPMFGASVIAGMGIHNWNYLKPHFPDKKIKGMLEVLEIRENEKATASIKWAYRFFDEAGVQIQNADFTVLHSTGGFTWV